MAAKIPVVYDVNVLVYAIVNGRLDRSHNAVPQEDLRSWPVLSPTTGNSSADCVGAANDNHDVALYLSPHILDNTRRVLVEAGFHEKTADDYILTLEEIAIGSGGQIMNPERTVHDCPDYEDNLILDLAHQSGAVIIVSEDTDLTHMSPWRGVPIQRPRDFASAIDMRRRHQVGRPMHPSTTDRLAQREEVRASRAQQSSQGADFALKDHDPQTFEEHRQRFDELNQDLRGIVGQWNPDNPARQPHLLLWKNNFTAIDRRIKDIDEMALTKPDTAQHLLTELTDKMTGSVQKLDPKGVLRERARAEASTSVMDTFRAEVDEDQLDDPGAEASR